jgi:RNA polymerase sigma factor (sigma-70 family)
MSETDDPLAPLAERALSGERASLEALCEKLQGPIFRLSLRMLGNPADAGDATQEILLQMVTHLSQFRGESRLLTWAYAIATRYLLRWRKKLHRERSELELQSRIEMGLAVTEPSSVPDGDARLLERETRIGCTQAMLACLSVEERMAIVLAELLGASDELGARLCEVDGAAYRKRLSRARGKLRPILEELCGLSREGAPCSCNRLARAKQMNGISTTRYTHLPVVDQPALQRALEDFGALRKLGPVFAIEPLLNPPEDLWAELRRKLPSVLGEVVP